MRIALFFGFVTMAMWTITGCGGKSTQVVDADSDSDSDTDSDADNDSDTDVDTDTDVDSDTDVDTDVDTDSDSDTDCADTLCGVDCVDLARATCSMLRRLHVCCAKKVKVCQ